jgi:hypothetical protein
MIGISSMVLQMHFPMIRLVVAEPLSGRIGNILKQDPKICVGYIIIGTNFRPAINPI